MTKLYLVTARKDEEGVWQRTPSVVKTKKEAQAQIKTWVDLHTESGWDVRRVADAYHAVRGTQERSIALHEYTDEEWPSLPARIRRFSDWCLRELVTGEIVVERRPVPAEPKPPASKPRRGRKPVGV